jgi:quercetin dioxygenase-like cupin family protein
MNDTEGHSYLKDHTLKGEALHVELADAVVDVLKEARQAGTGHAGRTLVKDGPLRMIIVGFKDGASLQEHKAGGPVSIQVLAGDVEVKVDDAMHPLRKDDVLVLGADIVHSVQANTDSVILLTIGM